MTSALIPLHMGALHAYEQGIVAVIAFGPFVILGVVIAIRRRQDLAAEEAKRADAERADTEAGRDAVSGPRATPRPPGPAA